MRFGKLAATLGATLAGVVAFAGVLVTNAHSTDGPAGKVVLVHSDNFRTGKATYSYKLLTTRGALRSLGGGRAAAMGPAGLRATAAQTVATPTGAKKVAVILMTFSDGATQPYTPAYAQGVAFTNSDSVAAYYREVSWGKLNLSGDVFGWYALPDTSTSCNYTQWAAHADAAAQAAGVNLSAYDYRLYGFPSVPACGWSGLSYMPGTQSWVKGQPGMTTGVVAHELGHAFGLHHASSYTCTQGGVRVALAATGCTVASEYGDPFTTMGTAPREQTNFARSVTGWMPASDTLDVSATGSYAVEPIEPYQSSGVQGIRIARGDGTYLMLEFRQPALPFDNFGPTDPVVNGVTIRIVPSYSTISQTKLVDTTPATASFVDAPLTAGRSVTDPVSGATITTQSVSSLGASVHIDFGSAPPPPATDTQPPTVPAALSASATDSTDVQVSWAPSTDNVGVSGYKVYRNGSMVATAGSTAYTDSGLTPGTTYSYSVKATDTAGNQSGTSNPASTTTPTFVDTTAPSAPAGLAATALDVNRISLAWSASTDNVGVTGYRVYRGSTLVGTTGTTDFTDTGLAPNTTYSYFVTAFDAAGYGSLRSNTASAKTVDLNAPSVPQNLNASVVDVHRIALTWSASTDNAGVTGYKLYRNGKYLRTVTSTSYTDASLVANTTYVYNVTARDAVGSESAFSNPASATTVDTTAPNAPVLAGKKLSATDGYLYWGVPFDNDKVTSYRLYRDGVLLTTNFPCCRNYTDHSPSTGTHSYRMVALDAAGNVSAWSNTVSLSY